MAIATAAKKRPGPKTSAPTDLAQEFGVCAAASAASVAMLLVSFPPIGWWPLALVGLAPWTYAICAAQRAWVAHWVSFVLGFAFFLIGLRWLMPVTGLGYTALAFYLAMYWPLAGWAVRTGRRVGVPAAWSLPAAWVACELLRAWAMTGFPWLFVSHAFFEVPILIQIADTTGAYGVTFLAAMVSGLLADWALARRPATRLPRMRLLTSTAAAAALVAATLGYGAFRLSEGGSISDGPRIAVVQHDFPLVSTPPYSAKHNGIVFASYLALAAEAAPRSPHILLFPETVWGSSQNIGFIETHLRAADGSPGDRYHFSKICHDASAALARGDYAEANRIIGELERRIPREYLADEPDRRLGRLPFDAGPPTTVVLGTIALEDDPRGIELSMRRYNSAVVYDADGTQRRQRYDKNHLVVFGEVVPFRHARIGGLSLHWLYTWLNSLSPFSDGGKFEYSLTPGDGLTVFDLDADGKTYQFGTPICYEDVMPYLIRRYVWQDGRRRVHFLLNMSNDAWFLHSDELSQHLAICTFRAVENRVGIARAVNTGVSGFIDPMGRIYGVVRNNHRRWGEGSVGVSVENVRVDSRTPPYAWVGDAFALLCLAAALPLWLGAITSRWVLGLQRRIAGLLRRPAPQGGGA